MPNQPDIAWKRLGDLLVRRRLELDPRYRNRAVFIAEKAIGYRIVNDVELAKRDNYEPATLASLEVAYELPPGTIKRVLDGPGPEGAALTAASAVAQELMPRSRAEVENLLLTAAIRYGLPPDALTGAQIFGSGPEAATWNGLGGMEMGVEDRVAVLALARASAEAARQQAASRRADPSAN